MAEPSNQRYARTDLDIEYLISAPLIAASKANAVMVTGQTRFLLEYCFVQIELDENGNDKRAEDNSQDPKNKKYRYEPVMVTMSINKGVITKAENPKGSTGPPPPDYIKTVVLTFSVPLLCLVPINSLAIETVDLEFDMEITSVVPGDVTTANGTNNKIIDKQAQLKGRITNSQSSNPASNKSQMGSKLKVNISAGPLPLPKGVLSIIDLYTNAIQPLPLQAAKPE